MAKNKGLHISKDMLESIINDYANIIKIECKNTANNQMRYYLERDNNAFYIDVYFRIDHTITLLCMSSGCNNELSKELVQMIKSYDEYKEVISGSFTCHYNIENFNGLIEYLSELEGVTKVKCEENGNNGLVVQFTSEIGDKITLTFYKSTSRMMFQGYLMKLYLEVKSFISPFVGNIVTELKGTEKKDDINIEVNNYINTYIPTSYNNLNDIIKGFIRDSFTLLIADSKLSEYSSWTFPILKALENRLKQIISNENITIDDTRGFKYLRTDGIWCKIFYENGQAFTLEYKLSKKINKDTADVLIDCYTFYNKNRHTLFHTKQRVSTTRILETSEKAKMIILEVCKILEKSYTILGK